MAGPAVQDRASAASTGTQTAMSSDRALHLEMPEPRRQANAIFHQHDGSSPEELSDEHEMKEEDVQSVVGVSISQAQARFMSPQTPAAEKAAAMAELEGGGLFDGAGDDRIEGRDIGRTIDQGQDSGDGAVRPSQPVQRQTSIQLPSPWKAEPKHFEKQPPQRQSQQSTGATNMLSDLNVRRYMSTFNLPSLSKTPFKDFAIPSLSSILSNTRSHSPVDKTEPRRKKANTIDDPGSSWSSSDSSLQQPIMQAQLEKGTGSSATKLPVDQNPAKDSQSETSKSCVMGGSDFTMAGHQRAASNASVVSSQNSHLRRTTSDQSLLLRRVTSAGSSLGDDSRWENVQEQVNSRMKAIKDSLQDSNIKLPSMPNLQNLNLSSLRPEFTRNRARSEVKRPSLHGQGDLSNSSDATSQGIKVVSEPAQQKHMGTSQFGETPSKVSHSCLDEALDRLTGDLVIMGGYRGSVLRSAQPPHRQVWVPVKVGLNIRKVNLEVGLQPEDEENMHDHIFADGMLSHIGPVDMGRRLLKRLRTCRNASEGRLRVHDYGYDWRLSPHLLSRRLLAFLQELECNSSNTPTQKKGAFIIAHSMGGLITRHAVNRRPELFAGVVYAGVPQHCVNILGPIRNGDEVLLSSKVLTAQVNFTLRSSFLLLPEDGKCFINKETKERYPVNFFDVSHWQEYAWSPCIAPALPSTNPQETRSLLGTVTDMLPSMPSLPLPRRKASLARPKDEQNSLSAAADIATSKVSNVTHASTTKSLDPQMSPTQHISHPSPQSTIPLPEALAYLTRTLNATLAFKAEMVYDPTYAAENVYPPLSILYANNTPTVVAARVTSREAIKHADAYDDLQFASGDGVCLARAAMLPEGYRCAKGGKVRTERGHVGLLGDLEAVGRCLNAVIEGRRQGIGLGLERRY